MVGVFCGEGGTGRGKEGGLGGTRGVEEVAERWREGGGAEELETPFSEVEVG